VRSPRLRAVPHTISLHKDAAVVLSDGSSCRVVVARVHSEALAGFFDSETVEPRYKSDLCRLAMLYEQGGYSFDNDLVLLCDVRQHIHGAASLAAVLEDLDKHNAVQAFLAAAPRHDAIAEAFHLRFLWNRRGNGMQPEVLHGLMGPVTLGRALRRWLSVHFLQHTLPAQCEC